MNQTKQAKKNTFIVAPLYDAINIIGAPIFAFLLAIPFSSSVLLKESFSISSASKDFGTALIAMFIMSHLFIVFFRTHLNRKILRLYPVRFVWLPLVMLIAAFSSVWVAVVFAVLATWWDVYHSSLQTFGFGRIYDSKMGNAPQTGRRLDYFFNLLFYVGPILAGASLMAHVNDFVEFKKVDSLFFQNLPMRIFNFRNELQTIIFAIGAAFILIYIFAYIRLYQKGYKISWQKTILYISTAIVSIFAWGFNSFGEAFFIMNFFHAWQYFAIVWAKERKTMVGVIKGSYVPFPSIIAFALFLFVGLGYGLWTEVMPDVPAIFAFTITVSLLHFWYDGFVWSVRKSQI